MENPWGEPSPPLALAPTIATASTPKPEQRRSIEYAQDDEDAPAWDADDPAFGHGGGDDDGDDDDVDWAREARAANLERLNRQEQINHDNDQQQEAVSDGYGEEPLQTETSARDDTAQSAPAADEEPRPSSELPPPVPVVPTSLPSFDADAGPQMDDFPDDDEEPVDFPATTAQTATAGFTEADHAFADNDDFDDFDEPAVGGGDEGDDDDFGDFGDFGDAAPLDEAAFESTPLPSSTPDAAPAPFASTSAAALASYPPLRFELGDRSRQAISSQLHDFWEGAFPAAARAVNDEPERQVEGLAQILVSESSRSLWAELSTLPPLRPVDWRRSRVRREHLISMGFPVSQEEEAPLPSMAAISSLNPSFSVPARPSSAPPPASASISSGPGRPSTPLGTTYSSSASNANISNGGRLSSLQRSTGPGGFSPSPPPFDRERAEQALSVAEEDLSLRPLAKLRDLDAELDRISVEASELLTHALMMREKETQDKEVYNGMIQDLVVAAAKMKTSSAVSAGVGKEPKRSGSGRWKLGK